MAWLRGELRRISEVKRALIFQRIARHNARHMLASLAHWLRITGSAGLLLILDIARCPLTVPREQRDERRLLQPRRPRSTPTRCSGS